MDKVLFSSEKMDWETPGWLFKALDKIFGFELDAAAGANNAKCEKYYSLECSGLENPWFTAAGGAIWCNPPYGREIGSWVKKAYEESLKSDREIVLLIPSRTDTAYFHDYIYKKAEIFFLKGRIKFLDAEHKENHPAPFPSMIAVFNWKGQDVLKALEEKKTA